MAYDFLLKLKAAVLNRQPFLLKYLQANVMTSRSKT